jgi:hypothetical protein
MQERATEFYQKAEGDFLEQSELGLNFLCWWSYRKQMIPHIQYKGKTIVLWLIYWQQPDIFLCLRNGIRYKTVVDDARENEILECRCWQWLLFVSRTRCIMRLLPYNTLKRSTIEGSFSGRNLNIVLIVLLCNKINYFRPIFTT